MLDMAELLNLPQITSVRKVTVEGDSVVAERSLEDAVETDARWDVEGDPLQGR